MTGLTECWLFFPWAKHPGRLQPPIRPCPPFTSTSTSTSQQSFALPPFLARLESWLSRYHNAPFYFSFCSIPQLPHFVSVPTGRLFIASGIGNKYLIWHPEAVTDYLHQFLRTRDWMSCVCLNERCAIKEGKEGQDRRSP